MLRWSVVTLALLVNLPGLYQALITQTVPVESALWHLMVTVPVVAVLLTFLRSAGKPTQRR